MLRTVNLLGLLALSLAVFPVARVAAQSAPESQLQWSEEIDAHIQFPSQWRVLAFAGGLQARNYTFDQWYAAVGVGYQFKQIPFVENIDPDKQFHFVFGAGYEHLDTTSARKIENRNTLDVTAGYNFPGDVLARDRNWLELRWISGQFYTTYRNRLTLEREFRIGRLRLSPYGSVEAFWDSNGHVAEEAYGRARGSWNQWWYAAGFQLPYERQFMLQAFYRRQNCPSCAVENWNVWGLVVHFFFGNAQ